MNSMKNKSILFFVGLLLSAGFGAGNLLWADTLSGHVTDGTNGLPLSGATATVLELSQSKTTDATGAYNFGTLPNGTYTVTAQVAGYVTQQKTVTLSTPPAAPTGLRLR
jgi:iron complex outermembrane receptor protein